MSKPLSLWMKIRLFKAYLKTQQDGVLVACGICKSWNVTFGNQVEDVSNSSTFYSSTYTCRNCGADCKNTQIWTKTEVSE